jgi:nitric oxide reductase large subunit
VFGFLINLPAVSYYEIGTALTANHAHTAMMGVYGMLAAGLLLFCLRYLTQADKWSDRAGMISFWSLNIGLTWMAIFNLFPLGIVQLYHAVDTGYWYARSLDFLMLSWVNTLEWARLPGDALFILGGALPFYGFAGAQCVSQIRFNSQPKQNYRACSFPTSPSRAGLEKFTMPWDSASGNRGKGLSIAIRRQKTKPPTISL